MTSIMKVFLFLSTMLILSGCIDEYKPAGPDPDAYRIVGIINIDSSGKTTTSRFDYHSLENRLYSMSIYIKETETDSSPGTQYYNLEDTYMNYPEDSYPDYIIEMHKYIRGDDDMYLTEINSEILIRSNLRIQDSETTNVNDTNTIRRTEYFYDEMNRLVESLKYRINQWSYKDSRNLYSYLDGHISQITTYKRDMWNEWAEDQKTVFQFSGNRLDEYTIFKKVNKEWQEKWHITYSYNNGNLSLILTYVKDMSDDWVLYQSEGFSYNAHGYLTVDSVQRGTYSSKQTMLYYKGEGNAREILVNPIDELYCKPQVR